MITALFMTNLQIKGDLPGHPFRGNQWSGGQGTGLWTDSLQKDELRALSVWKVTADQGESVKYSDLKHALNGDPPNEESKKMAEAFERGIVKAPDYSGSLYRGIGNLSIEDFEKLSEVKEGESFEFNSVAAGSKDVETAGRFILAQSEGSGWKNVIVEITGKNLGKDISDIPNIGKNEEEVFIPKDRKYEVVSVARNMNLSDLRDFSEFAPGDEDFESGTYDLVMLRQVSVKSSRLAILHKALQITTQAVRLKQLLLKDQLRNAVVKAVHLKQYAETEAELTDAVEGLIKEQFADAGRKLDRTKAESDLIEKGDKPGHPFRGNQWDGQAVPIYRDRETIQELKIAVKLWKGGNAKDQAMEALRSIATDKTTRGFVIRGNDGPVGIASVHIQSYGVVVDHLGSVSKGAGTVLMRRICRMAAENDLPVELIAGFGSSGFYTKLGMTQENTRDEPTFRFSVEQARVFGGSDQKSPSHLVTKSFQVDSIFDPRDWDSDLVNTALPILMKKAGEAAAAQMLLMGVDVAPRGKRTKGDLPGHPFRGNQWSGGQAIDGGMFSEMPSDRADQVYEDTEVWMGKLDRDTVDIIDDYIGDGHKVLNGKLRQGPEALSKEDKQIAKTIDDAMVPLQGDATLFRGVDKSTWDSLYADLGEGDTIRDRAFTSTSMAKNTAGGFASGGTIEIAAPKGTMCLPVAGIGEMEILLPRGMKMKVVGVDKDRKVISVVPVSQGSRQPDGNPSEGWDWSGLQKSPSHLSTKHFQTKASHATEWLLNLDDADIDTMALWPEVFTLPSGLTVDLGFATEWPDWMKAEISQQIKECFEQPFWAGINDTTAKGIQSHVLKGIEEGLSIREIREQMVGDGLDEYYHNRGINIARTESGNALNGARSAAMDRLSEEVPGLKTKKTWMSELGTTTRDTHANLDGVPADRDGMWYLGGVRIPWPAHWNLDPSERCNCHCLIVQSWGMGDEAASELIADYNARLDEERQLKRLWEKGDLPGHPFRGNQYSGGGLQASIAGMISHLETIFKGPGRAAAVNEVLTAAKFPEYLKGILTESPGVDEIEAVVSWSVRRGRIWEVA